MGHGWCRIRFEPGWMYDSRLASSRGFTDPELSSIGLRILQLQRRVNDYIVAYLSLPPYIWGFFWSDLLFVQTRDASLMCLGEVGCCWRSWLA